MLEQPKNILFPSKEEALLAWARLVRSNREQAERFREAPEKPDFYAPTASIFEADPRRTADAALEILRDIVRPDDTWLDIGAGGGRYTLPLALSVGVVIAIEPSESMRSILYQGVKDNGIQNIRVIAGRWPVKEIPKVDVALISHVGYDIEDIGPFLDAMEASARRLCVAILRDAAPSSSADWFWPRIHGEKRKPLPSLREFLILQIARGRLYDVRLVTEQIHDHSHRKTVDSFLRQQLFIEENSEKDRRLKQLIEEQVKEQGGRFSLTRKSSEVGIVSWTPHLPESWA
jgi:hypothetical protein